MAAIFGWCAGPTGIRPPHERCKVRFSTKDGRTYECECKCHTRPESIRKSV